MGFSAMWDVPKTGSKPEAPLPDAELRQLLQRVAAHDRSAFRCLYHALRPALVRHLHRLVPRADLVDELLNDVMWVVWQSAAGYRGDAQVTTWVLGIATLKSHRVRDRLRREQESIVQSRLSEGDGATPAANADQELAQGMAQLSAEHRDTLELTYYFGYSCSEVARLHGCPVGTVKTRLFYARRRLKQLLQECEGETI
jgi:RNA polymerase sigma-70 factor, ECF subfamily